MAIKVEALRPAQEEAYSDLLLSRDDTLIYASIAYRNFLRKVLNKSQDVYLAAWDGDRIVGALPGFVSTDGECGKLLNSLPFFGSNGGLVVAPNLRDASVVKSALLRAFGKLAETERVASSTIISNPLDPDVATYETQTGFTHRDERIGQFTPLPVACAGTDINNTLMASFHQKTRNMIRKGLKSEFTIRQSGEESILRKLHKLHLENMGAIGGQAKGWHVFEAIRECFTYDREYRVYVAEWGDEMIGALLVLNFNKTAEYFIPAIAPTYRTDQALSALIFQAMQDATARGYQWWNWGGTWLSQEGVYRFKSRWGTRDMRYYYYTSVREPNLLERSPERLLECFPYFFSVPFHALRHETLKNGPHSD